MTFIIDDILDGKNILVVGNRGSGKTKLALTLAVDLISQMPNITVTLLTYNSNHFNHLRKDIVDYITNSKLEIVANNSNIIKFSNGSTIKSVFSTRSMCATSSDYVVFDDIKTEKFYEFFNSAIPTLCRNSCGNYILIFDESDSKFYEQDFVSKHKDFNIYETKRKDCVIYDIRN